MTIDSSPALPFDRSTRKAARRSPRLTAPVVAYAVCGTASLAVWGAIFVALSAVANVR